MTSRSSKRLDVLVRPSALLVVAVVTTGCFGANDRAPAAGRREFPVTGLIAAAPSGGVVSVAHDEISGFMPAMTMPFTLADPAEASRLTPGARVRFVLTVGATSTRARAFEVIGHDRAALDVHRRATSIAAARVRPGDPIPAFALVDQDGERVTDAGMRGHRTVLTFIFTRCPVPEFCPRITGAFRVLQRATVGDPRLNDVRLLSVSLDPAFDTPAVLKAYGASMGADFSRWRFATGTADDVGVLTRALAVRVEPSSAVIDHTLATALIGADGTVVEIWRGNEWTVEEVLARLDVVR